MNKVILMGRLTRDRRGCVTHRVITSTAIARYSLAVDRRFRRDGDEADSRFYQLRCIWQNWQSLLERFGRKGTKIRSGRDVFRPEATPTRTDSVYTRRTLLLRM